MFMTHVRVWSVALIAAGLLGGSAPVDSDGSSAGGKIAAALANPDYVIQGRFNAIAPSTGNLYLTSNFYFRGSKTWEGDIFRTAKTNNNIWSARPTSSTSGTSPTRSSTTSGTAILSPTTTAFRRITIRSSNAYGSTVGHRPSRSVRR